MTASTMGRLVTMSTRHLQHWLCLQVAVTSQTTVHSQFLVSLYLTVFMHGPSSNCLLPLQRFLKATSTLQVPQCPASSGPQHAH